MATTADSTLPHYFGLPMGHGWTRLDEYQRLQQERDEIHRNTRPDRAITTPDSPTLSTSSAHTTTDSSFDTLSVTTTGSTATT